MLNYNNEFIPELGESVFWFPMCRIDNLSIGLSTMNDNSPLYFKVRKLNKYDENNIDGICRVSLLEPKYIIGYNENMILTENEKIKLINKLNSNIKYPKWGVELGFPSESTVWQFIQDSINNEIEGRKLNIEKIYNLPMPNYMLL